jgi:hypothetical protein
VESLFTASLHLSDFVQTQNDAKNHLTGLEIHSRSKIKSTPPFCLKGTKG